MRPGSVRAAVAGGIGLSPEERKSQGLLLEEPVFKNVTLSTFARFARATLLDERRERAASREQIEALDLRPAEPDRVTGTLSGGNQQKILLARWLVHGTRVLLLDEPTRGVDVGARTEIYQLIRRLAACRHRHRRGLQRDRGGTRPRRSACSSSLRAACLLTTTATDIDEHRVLDLVMEGIAA